MSSKAKVPSSDAVTSSANAQPDKSTAMKDAMIKPRKRMMTMARIIRLADTRHGTLFSLVHLGQVKETDQNGSGNRSQAAGENSAVQ